MLPSLSDKARLVKALRGLISTAPAVRREAEREWLAVPVADRERVRLALVRAKLPRRRLTLAEAQKRTAKLRAAAGRN